MSDSAEAQLLVTINHAWDNQQRDTVALLIRLEMIVPAEPVGSRVANLPQRKRTLAIWSGSHLELGASSSATRFILEAVDSALKDLLESRQVERLDN